MSERQVIVELTKGLRIKAVYIAGGDDEYVLHILMHNQDNDAIVLYADEETSPYYGCLHAPWDKEDG